MSLFLNEGYLLPAVRNTASLNKLREKQKESGKIINVPSESYVNFVEEQLEGHKINYDLIKVAELFKRRAMSAFNSENIVGRGKLSKYNAKKIYDYFKAQKPEELEWAKLKIWLDKNGFSERDSKIINKVVLTSYLHNVPSIIGTRVDVPMDNPFPIDLMLGNQKTYDKFVNEREQSLEVELPLLLCLSDSFLSKVRVEAFIEIKGSQTKDISPIKGYKEITKSIKEFQETGELNQDDFIELLYNYLKEVETIFIGNMVNKDKSEYLALMEKQNQSALIKLKRNVFVNLVGFLFPSTLSLVFSLFWSAYSYVEDNFSPEIKEAYFKGSGIMKNAYQQGIITPEEKLLIGVHKKDETKTSD